MNDRKEFHRALLKIALPVTLQSLLQSSFSVVDQVMTGQLGSVSIAGIGLAAKFFSLFSVLISAMAVVAGIMISQYVGKEDEQEVGRSFWLNLSLALLAAGIFMIFSGLFPGEIMKMYTEETDTCQAAASYLRILSLSLIPMTVSTLLAAFLRCREAAMLPLYSGILSAVVNTVLNYLWIFGKLGFPALGADGAAWATVTARIFDCLLMLLLFFRLKKRESWRLPFRIRMDRAGWELYAGILMPVLVCEFFWSLGENVYASIYGHMGTESCAAMTLTTPIQVLMIGALSGISQAAGIMVGRSLGSGEYEKAWRDSKRLMLYGLAGSVFLSVLLMILSGPYVGIYRVEDRVRRMAVEILTAFAVISPVKVQNMILGGGIIRSGGKTTYVMIIDLIGTWVFGVPLGLLAAFVLRLPIAWVYFILSLEECVRFGISLAVFRRKQWMRRL